MRDVQQYAASQNHQEFLHAQELADRLTNELGFVPRAVFRNFAGLGELASLRLNDSEAGFVGWRNKPGYAHICWTAVQADARLIENASALVSAAATDAIGHGNRYLYLACAEDLPANSFWRAIGCVLESIDNGKADRGRRRNWWRLDLDEYVNGPHFHELQLCPTTGRFRSISLPGVDLTWPATLDLSQFGLLDSANSSSHREALQRSLQAMPRPDNGTDSRSLTRTGTLRRLQRGQSGRHLQRLSLLLPPARTFTSSFR